MTTNNNDLPAALELWDVMGEVEGLRPKHIYDGAVDCDHHFYYDCDMGYDQSGIDDTDTLFILTGHAERWLGQRLSDSGMSEENPTRARVAEWVEKMHKGSLPAAILAEAGRG